MVYYGRLYRVPLNINAHLTAFLDGLTSEIGCLAGALSFLELSNTKRRPLVRQLARTCRHKTTLTPRQRVSTERTEALYDGLQKAAAIAVSHGLGDDAVTISRRAPHERPGMWSMVNRYSNGEVFSFLFHVALQSAVQGSKLTERMCCLKSSSLSARA